MSKTIWIAVGISMASVVTSCIQAMVDENEHLDDIYQDESKWETSKRKASDFIVKVGAVYWFFAATYLLVFCIITTLTGNGAGLLASLAGFSEKNAIWVIGTVYYFSLVIPLVNFLVYLTGRRDYWMTAGTLVIMTGLIAYLSSMAVQAYLLTILIGLGFVLFDPTASNSMSLVAPPGTRGFATGLLKFLRYTGTGTVALIVGGVLDQERYSMMDSVAWKHMIIFFLVLAVVAVVTSLGMVWANYYSRDRLLSVPEEQRKKRPWEVGQDVEELQDSGESNWLIQSFSSRGVPMGYDSINGFSRTEQR
ncbi:hypothetical protein RvY_17891 [Ramazzottius varieornatus]|uniref:Lysosomal dipeptide transporter MFSD1 n=1 Tax=Ramazzottius varieornatus TaxID=947166 RepID=A0A1D1W7E8_RAMVA|nr:hypothetical protein RvY_17891 [Ramazzottius varieornatus]